MKTLRLRIGVALTLLALCGCAANPIHPECGGLRHAWGNPVRGTGIVPVYPVR